MLLNGIGTVYKISSSLSLPFIFIPELERDRLITLQLKREHASEGKRNALKEHEVVKKKKTPPRKTPDTVARDISEITTA